MSRHNIHMESGIVNSKLLTVFYVSIQTTMLQREQIMKLALLSVALLLLLVPPPVRAAYYQWVDAAGVTHFTDNKDNIPGRYRAHAKTLELSDEPSGLQPTPQAGRPVLLKPQAAPPQTAAGQSEQVWRERFSKLRDEMTALQAGLADKQTKLVELRRKRAIYMRAQDRVAVNSMQAEISADEVHIADLQGRIDRLEGEAAKASVPAAWRH